MPEWYVVILALGLLLGLAPFWKPLIWFAPVLIFAVAVPVAQAVLHARRLPLNGFAQNALVSLLNLLQPAARLHGRVVAGLTPWGRRRLKGFALPRGQEISVWSERWQSPNDWLTLVENPLQEAGAGVFRGGDYDAWDLEIRGGVLGGVRLRMLAEEHGGGKQLVRFHVRPHWPDASVLIFGYAAILTIGAAMDAARIAMCVFGFVALICLVAMIAESAAAMALVRDTLNHLKSRDATATAQNKK
jgi:hypothetical protein